MNPIRRTEVPFCEGRKLVPQCPVASKVLEETYADMNFINETLLPFLRNRGITRLTTSSLYTFAEKHECFVGGDQIVSRSIIHPDFLTFTGRKVSFNRDAFRQWYETTDEGRTQKAFRDSISKTDNFAIQR